ncbi:hypothetical protein [Novosphingobium sp.]|jgi:hypothetical protein|uniref:hypothetical protein n=1 Tax=Novosphingobium sp. TaxID=1874826 RepID=UPI00352B16C4
MPAECQHPFDMSLPSTDGERAPDVDLTPAAGRRHGVRVALVAVRATAPLMLSLTLWAIVGWAVWKGG